MSLQSSIAEPIADSASNTAHDTASDSAPVNTDINAGAAALARHLANTPDTESVKEFIPGPGIVRLGKFFDPQKLRQGLEDALAIGGWRGEVVKAISLTKIPGDSESQRGNNLRGLYWTRADESYEEVQRESAVAEEDFSEFVEEYKQTYFYEVWKVLCQLGTIGRCRLLLKEPRSTLSWHRDPEPRLHVPVVTNPGSVMVVNSHATHLPADGSVYFTDTRGYHNAYNGGEEPRIHLVATLPLVG